MYNSILKNKDIFYSLVLFVILWIVQIFVIVLYYPKGFNFGYEFARVAYSLIVENGYVNPYKGYTGPTAHVLPALVYLHYIAFWLFGIDTLSSFIFLSFFKITAYSLSFFFIIKSLKQNNVNINYLAYSGLFVLFIAFSPTLNFKHTGDLWSYIFLVAWFLYSISKYFNDRKKGTLHLIIFYLISPLINSSIALAGITVFGISSLLFLYEQTDSDSKSFFKKIKDSLGSRRNYPYLRNMLLFPVIFLIPVLMWSYRNYKVFDTFIPSKSNLWLEYYFSNIKDDDGLLSFSTVIKHYPINNDSLRELMAINGEVAVMKQLERIGKLHRKNHKDVYYRKLFNRFINVFFYTKYDMDVARSMSFQKFSTKDKLALVQDKLVLNKYWTCLELSDERFTSLIRTIEIEDEQLIIDDWKSAKQDYYKRKHSYWVIFRGLVMGIITSLAALLLLLKKRGRINLLVRSAILFYLLYIIPYILFSHQLRYQRPLFAVQLILIYTCISYYCSNCKYGKMKFWFSRQ